MKINDWAVVLTLVVCTFALNLAQIVRLREQREFNHSVTQVIERLAERDQQCQCRSDVKTIVEHDPKDIDAMTNEELSKVYLQAKGEIDAAWTQLPKHSRLKDAIREWRRQKEVDEITIDVTHSDGGCNR